MSATCPIRRGLFTRGHLPGKTRMTTNEHHPQHLQPPGRGPLTEVLLGLLVSPPLVSPPLVVLLLGLVADVLVARVARGTPNLTRTRMTRMTIFNHHHLQPPGGAFAGVLLAGLLVSPPPTAPLVVLLLAARGPTHSTQMTTKKMGTSRGEVTHLAELCLWGGIKIKEMPRGGEKSKMMKALSVYVLDLIEKN